MSKLNASYLAGFIDGEGYIALKVHKNKSNGNLYYTPILKIAQTDESIICWLKESFGGWYYKREYKEDSHSKDSYYWTLTGTNLKPFLQKVCPYLKLKKKQCELVLKKIKMQETLGDELPYKEISTINKQREQKMQVNKNYREQRRNDIQEIYDKLRELNKRGK